MVNFTGNFCIDQLVHKSLTSTPRLPRHTSTGGSPYLEESIIGRIPCGSVDGLLLVTSSRVDPSASSHVVLMALAVSKPPFYTNVNNLRSVLRITSSIICHTAALKSYKY